MQGMGYYFKKTQCFAIDELSRKPMKIKAWNSKSQSVWTNKSYPWNMWTFLIKFKS